MLFLRVFSRTVSVPNLVVYIDSTHDFYVMDEEEHPKAMTKTNVEDFFSKISKGELKPKGGSSIKEQAKRAMGDFANFFIVSRFCPVFVVGHVIGTEH